MRTLSILLLLALAAPVGAQDWRPLLTETGVDPAVRGIWASRGYGWVLAVPEAGVPTVYTEGRAGCLPDEASAEALVGNGLFSRAGDVLRIGLAAENTTRYTFDRLPALPAACDAPPGDSPREVFDYAWAVMDEHYAFFDLYGVDWQARYDALAPTVTDDLSEAELRDALLALLEGLDDGHLSLAWTVDGEEGVDTAGGPEVLRAALRAGFEAQDADADYDAFVNRWYQANRVRIREELLGGAFEVQPGTSVFWGRIGDVGYVSLSRMGGYADAEDPSLHDEVAAAHALATRVLTDLADTRALIVDVAFNQGGLDDVALALAGPLADAPTVAITKAAHPAEAATRQTLAVVPRAPQYRRPVAVLTSDVTISAAESFVLLLRALPTVVHAGETTRGALSDQLTRPLPNGWMLTLSNEVYRDADGQVWEGRGIPPEWPLPLFADGDLDGHFDAVRALAERLASDVP